MKHISTVFGDISSIDDVFDCNLRATRDWITSTQNTIIDVNEKIMYIRLFCSKPLSQALQGLCEPMT
jgi:hypothetical protein